MKFLSIFLITIFIIHKCGAPPVTKNNNSETENEVDEDDALLNIEYHRYLKEIIQALETDNEFRKKLETADEEDIKNGKIANELEFVSRNVRTKLDEIKRTELNRLRKLAIKQYEESNGLKTDHFKVPEHLDPTNAHTFEVKDLKNLIEKTTKDLNEADKKRREDFKKYEMHKKFEEEEKIKKMNEEEMKKYEEERLKMEQKHKQHEPLHHPGSKQQLEEVWEKQDHMENQEFDPKLFFHLHDLDGNGFWDEDEVKALFLKELDKLYEKGHPEDDLIERKEEMERMREHVFKEADLNKDNLLSYDEFLYQSNKPDFQKDPGWDSLDEQQVYSQQEYEAYKQHELEQQIANGMPPGQHPDQQHLGQNQFPPQHPNVGHPQPGYVQQLPPHQNMQYNNQVPPQQAQYGNQVPQQQYYQVPQPNTNQNYQQQQYPNPAQGQNQIPPQVQIQNQPGQAVPNQVPQQQYQPVQNQPGQAVPNQVPQQQYQPVGGQPQVQQNSPITNNAQQNVPSNQQNIPPAQPNVNENIASLNAAPKDQNKV